MRKMHPLLLSYLFVSDTKNQLVPKSTKPYLPKFTVMTAKLYLKRPLLLILAFFICGSAYAQTTAVKTATTAEPSPANVFNNANAKRALSNEAASAILNFENKRANKTEAQLKAEQSILMKTFCPNHPAYQAAGPGASKASMNAAENWRKKYPAEYASYLQIFHFKQ